MNEIARAAIEKYGKVNQTIVAIEEMAELTKELTKGLRGEQNRNQITEEVADVYVVLDQVMFMNGIDLNDVLIKMNQKLLRLKERMDTESESV